MFLHRYMQGPQVTSLPAKAALPIITSIALVGALSIKISIWTLLSIFVIDISKKTNNFAHINP